MATPKQTDPQFKLRFTPELRDQIEAAAKANNRSMNAEIVARLEGSFHGAIGNAVTLYLPDDLIQRMTKEWSYRVGGTSTGDGVYEADLPGEIVKLLEAEFPEFDLGTLITKVSEELNADVSDAERERVLARANAILAANDTGWRIEAAIQEGVKRFTIQAADDDGLPVSGAL